MKNLDNSLTHNRTTTQQQQNRHNHFLYNSTVKNKKG
jgi:hypothetical protein